MVRHGKLLFLIIIFLALQVLILSRAQAEYRVYRLGVKYDDNSQEQQVLTTLDNIQFDTYYKITSTQATRIIEHWMCRGRTDNFTPYCEKPIPQNRLGSSSQASNAPQPDQGPVTPSQKN